MSRREARRACSGSCRASSAASAIARRHRRRRCWTLWHISSAHVPSSPSAVRGFTDLRERDTECSDSAQGRNFAIRGLRLRPPFSGHRGRRKGQSDQPPRRPIQAATASRRRARSGRSSIQNALARPVARRRFHGRSRRAPPKLRNWRRAPAASPARSHAVGLGRNADRARRSPNQASSVTFRSQPGRSAPRERRRISIGKIAS